MKRKVFLSIISVFYISKLLASSKISSKVDSKKITVFWDASSFVDNKNLNLELEFLDAYLNEVYDAEVKLVVFSNEVLNFDFYPIINGDSSSLIKYLKNIVYDGDSVIPIEHINGWADQYLIFTNGLSLNESDYSTFDAQIIAINSSDNVSSKVLHNFAFKKLGYYFDLRKIGVKNIVQDIISDKIIFTIYEPIPKSQDEFLISGFCYSYETGDVIQNFEIFQNGKLQNFTINNQGMFETTVRLGDTLTFNSLGKNQKKLVVPDKELQYVYLTEQVENLDEVLLSSRKSSKSNLQKITAYGKVSEESVGYAIETIDRDDISDSARTLGEMISGKFSGVQLFDSQNLGKVIVRNNRNIPTFSKGDNKFKAYTSIYPLFVVDGIPLKRSTPDKTVDYSFINPDDVKSITVLKGLAATNRYGTQGSAGVFLIETKSKNKVYIKEKTRRNYTRELSIFSGDLSIIDIKTSTKYVDRLMHKNINTSYQNYLKYKDEFKEDPRYFLNSSEFFHKNKKYGIAKRILSNILVYHKDQLSVLRVAAFIFRKRNNHSEALKIYERILKLSPYESQNYLDFAKALGNANKNKEAITLFQKILDGSANLEIDFSNLRPQIVYAYKKLLNKRNGSWDTSSIPKNYLNAAYQKLRLEIEWTSYDDRFRLNIVSPNKKLLYWDHTEELGYDEIQNNLKYGVLSKVININPQQLGEYYFGIESKDSPFTSKESFAFVTIYKNYGSPNETKKQKLIPLSSNNNIFFLKTTLAVD
ncbi:TonB-dependent receptor plug domain-containing protein [Dokdonia sp. Hel_I_53]|uniref:TonB-dependent receptor plug domain-containing protein n=1 Tax=Dokdonia sp. Hel_I_53 TaxID=1566287 RepID=UPI00164463C9|nr:TonB-dependent receptor plug domain-containing protein [Dokdonia sp. Hel_I_53]